MRALPVVRRPADTPPPLPVRITDQSRLRRLVPLQTEISQSVRGPQARALVALT